MRLLCGPYCGVGLSFGAGVARQATHFSLLRQRKVSKRKATLVPASLRFATGNLRCSVQPGSKTTRLRLKQVFALIRLSLRSSAQPGRGNRDWDREPIPTSTRHGEYLFLPVFGFLFRLFGCSVLFPNPLWMRRGAQGQTDQGKNLFERSELFLTPAGPSTAGCP